MFLNIENSGEQDFLNPFPNKPWFSRVCTTSLLKTLWEKEKLLVTSNFSFSHSVFYPCWQLFATLIKIKIVFCKLFQFGSVQNLSFGKGLRIVGEYRPTCCTERLNEWIVVSKLTAVTRGWTRHLFVVRPDHLPHHHGYRRVRLMYNDKIYTHEKSNWHLLTHFRVFFF